MMMEANCVLCKESQENDNHLFRDCPISSHTWKASSLGINVYANQHVGVREWIKNFLNLFWKEDGNEIVLRNVDPNPNGIMHLIYKHIKQAREVVKMKQWPGSKWHRQEGMNVMYVIKGSHNLGFANLIIAGSWKKVKKKDYGEATIGWSIMENNRLIVQDG
ncbi:uncharacterized protein [Spinacia oleracea]|uniref:Reverse transcriptase zinc-binding domain-containing protein n=1 Tax=Spinacia oleracea TaxID=3562 RepID=A0ABM3QWY7_SPIOL|nr:uncharacterized protein LOC130462909 [Spinacia oleracea]